jgi:hypothetical protein
MWPPHASCRMRSCSGSRWKASTAKVVPLPVRQKDPWASKNSTGVTEGLPLLGLLAGAPRGLLGLALARAERSPAELDELARLHGRTMFRTSELRRQATLSTAQWLIPSASFCHSPSYSIRSLQQWL